MAQDFNLAWHQIFKIWNELSILWFHKTIRCSWELEMTLHTHTGSHTASILSLRRVRELPVVLDLSKKQQCISSIFYSGSANKKDDEHTSCYQHGRVWYDGTTDTLHCSKENKPRRLWRTLHCIFLNNSWKGGLKKKKKERLTWTTKLVFLDLGHVDPTELWWRWALCEQTKRWPLTQPLGQPGQVAVAIQIIWVQTAKGGKSN